MNKTPITYFNKQMEELENHIEENFGSHFECVMHEITSEYVHTDTFVVNSKDDEKIFVTCGMGARTMETPCGFKRCELVMITRKEFPVTKENARILAGELTKISKFPFREETWLGTGHTMDVSKKFKEAFGYDYVAFMKLPHSACVTGIKEDVEFLLVVPIYEAEREWCVENHTLAFLEKLNEKFEGKELYADCKRELFIPEPLDEDEMYDYNVMTVLGIDKTTLQKLCDYLEEQKQNGIEVTYDMIGKWVSENA
jgi:hypothetical protein